MRVLHVIERFNPNLGQEINFISKNSSSNIELYILTSKSLKTWNLKLDHEIVKQDYELSLKYNCTIIRKSISFEFGEKLWIKGLIKTIIKISPDVVYVHGIEYISFFRILLNSIFRLKCNIVTDTHSLPQFTYGSLFRKFYYTFLRCTIFKLVNWRNIITFYTAEENKRLLIDIYKIKDDIVKPFPIGADLKTFYFDNLMRNRIRESLNVSDNEILILYSGRITKSKSPHIILLALNLIKRKVSNKSITVVFIGSVDTEYLEKYVNNIEKSFYRFIILKSVPAIELKNYYSAADLAVFPKETTLSSLECQACCLPVIMEKNLTNLSRIQDEGLLYEENDIEDLSLKMVKLIVDDLYRNKLGINGLSWVQEKFDYLKTLSNMEKILLSNYNSKKGNNQMYD